MKQDEATELIKAHPDSFSTRKVKQVSGVEPECRTRIVKGALFR